MRPSLKAAEHLTIKFTVTAWKGSRFPIMSRFDLIMIHLLFPSVRKLNSFFLFLRLKHLASSLSTPSQLPQTPTHIMRAPWGFRLEIQTDYQ